MLARQAIRKELTLALSVFVSACTLPGASGSGYVSGSPAGMMFPAHDEIRALLEAVVPDGDVHGMIVGLVDADGSRRIVAHGNECPGGPSVEAESVFEIGSVSKAFLGVVLADMVGRGEVELGTPVRHLLPPQVRVPTWNGEEITLVALATHTSGLPPMPHNFPEGDPAAAYAGYTIADLYRFLAEYELPRRPGEAFDYSNLITLLGEALALQAGKSYEALLRERTLLPLGMENTVAAPEPVLGGRMTCGSNEFGDPQPYFVAPAFVASGGLRSNMADLLAFAAANVSFRETAVAGALRESRRPRRAIEAGDSMGLGWGATGAVAGVAGGTFGYHARLLVDAERRRAVVVLANFASNDVSDVGLHLFDPETYPRPLASAAPAIATEYRRSGLEGALERYRALRESGEERWRLDESTLNSVGYWLLGRGSVEDAIAVFRVNTQTYPDSPNTYDSLGDGHMAAGRNSEAVASYRTAVLLAERIGHPHLEYFQANLDRAQGR